MSEFNNNNSNNELSNTPIANNNDNNNLNSNNNNYNNSTSFNNNQISNSILGKGSLESHGDINDDSVPNKKSKIDPPKSKNLPLTSPQMFTASRSLSSSSGSVVNSNNNNSNSNNSFNNNNNNNINNNINNNTSNITTSVSENTLIKKEKTEKPKPPSRKERAKFQDSGNNNNLDNSSDNISGNKRQKKEKKTDEEKEREKQEYKLEKERKKEREKREKELEREKKRKEKEIEREKERERQKEKELLRQEKREKKEREKREKEREKEIASGLYNNNSNYDMNSSNNSINSSLSTTSTNEAPIPPLPITPKRKGAPKKDQYLNSSLDKKVPILKKDKANPKKEDFEQFLSKNPSSTFLNEYESQVDAEIRKNKTLAGCGDKENAEFEQMKLIENQVYSNDLIYRYLQMNGQSIGPDTPQFQSPSLFGQPLNGSTGSFNLSGSTGGISGLAEDSSSLNLKKPRILKSDHPKNKLFKTSKKLEKLHNRYIRFQQPEPSLRGNWTIHDDYVLLENIQFSRSFQDISNCKEFSKQYTPEEIEKRWRSMLLDQDCADEVSGMMALNPYKAKTPPMTNEESQILINAPVNLSRANFIKLLQENRTIFHHNRTSKYLQSTYRSMLLHQDISKVPNYLKFLSDQKEKIKQLNDLQQQNKLLHQQQQIHQNQLSLINNSNNNNNTAEASKTITTSNNEIQDVVIKTENDSVNIQNNSINNENQLPIEVEKSKLKNEKLIEFLFHERDIAAPNVEINYPWDHTLTTTIPNITDIESDLILNPFSAVPNFLLSEKEEKRDMKNMVLIEKEYEMDRDKDFRALAVIRGKNIRYLMKSKNIIVGRDFSSKNQIDLDLNEENPNHINRISKKQLIIKLKSDANFYIQNIGKNTVFVNSCPLPPFEKIHLQDLSLIEFADMLLVFEINNTFLTKIKRLLLKPSNQATSTTASLTNTPYLYGGLGLTSSTTLPSTSLISSESHEEFQPLNFSNNNINNSAVTTTSITATILNK